MSVITSADQNIEEAKDHIKNAIQNLHKVIDPDTWGSKEYKAEYRKKIMDNYIKLLQIQEELG